MAKNFTSDKIVLGSAADPVRLSFLQLEEPKAFQNKPDGKKTFSGAALLDPSVKLHKANIEAIKGAAAKLIAAAELSREDIEKVCFGDGNKKKYDGYKDRFYISGSSPANRRVGTANRAGHAVVPGDKQFPYSGCFGIVKMTLWLQNNSYGKKIHANLLAIQFVKEGPSFGMGPVNVEEEFEAIGDAESSGGGDFDDDITF